MSAHKKEDPRALRSKRAFKDAAVSLLVEGEPISKLTVQQIANRAELNRATFYLHYQDVSDLIRQTAKEIFDELSTKLEPIMKESSLNQDEKLIKFLDYIYQNRKLFAILFEYKNFEQNFLQLIREIVETRRSRNPEAKLKERVSIEIMVASMQGIITWWIREGIDFSSEYIYRQINLLYKKQPE